VKISVNLYQFLYFGFGGDLKPIEAAE